MRRTGPTDEQIIQAFKGTDFGPEINESVSNKKLLIAAALFKRVCDYGDGSTITRIIEDLGLVSARSGCPFIFALRWAYRILIPPNY